MDTRTLWTVVRYSAAVIFNAIVVLSVIKSKVPTPRGRYMR